MPEPKTRDRIVDAFLSLAAERPFNEITLPAIAERAEVSLAILRENFDGRIAILADYVRQVDEKVLAGIDASLAEEGPRERLFDVLFARCEAHLPHREAMRGILRAACRDPVLALELNRLAVVSMGWMLAAAGIASTGGKGALRAQGLALVWARVMRVWLGDKEEGLPRTMAALDKRLREAERVVIGLDRLEGFACRVSGRRRTSRTPEASPDIAEGHPT